MCESIAFIAVGANIEPQRNIRAALTLLQQYTQVLASSTFYRTEPVGRPGQPHFINGVWLIRPQRGPREVRDEILHPVERQLGRRRTADKYAPRPIDLDLILYDDRVVCDGDLTLPHGDLRRPFVCVPVLELLVDSSLAPDAPLLDRIRALLPDAMSQAEPGEQLNAFTGELRSLLQR
ncbi:MAG: 2-amino-4-hydroxy-6-hydroxymethyldihydropteridine diphosphokinase [Sedimentisphaerales bacterium]|nr:2-amino-4-hydroxy-6-hydroxymethyldihydropteridine diphosphokinase [Sedimentisphaerales bacterium]